MTLGINTQMSDGTQGEFTPVIKYGAESGRLYKIDRVGGSNGFEAMPTELPAGTKIVFDFGGIAVGHMMFSAGAPPSFAVVPLGQAIPPRPSKDHKQGFKMLVHLGKNGGLREFASSSKTVTNALDELHTDFEAAPEARTGKVPIVEFGGADLFTSKSIHGSKPLYRPKFKIIGWIDRLSDFGPRTVPPPGQAQAKPNGATAPRPQASTDEWNTSLAAASQAHAAPPPGKSEWGGAGSTIDDDIPF